MRNYCCCTQIRLQVKEITFAEIKKFCELRKISIRILDKYTTIKKIQAAGVEKIAWG